MARAMPVTPNVNGDNAGAGAFTSPAAATNCPGLIANSRLKYALPPGGIHGLKFTVPLVKSLLMLVKLTPGPSYPVGPNGQPDSPKVQMPSPSLKSKTANVLLSWSLHTEWLESFCTPSSVSSLLSYGPWVESPRASTAPLARNTMRMAQLVSNPTAGHCVNGGVCAVATSNIPATRTAVTHTRYVIESP